MYSANASSQLQQPRWPEYQVFVLLKKNPKYVAQVCDVQSCLRKVSTQTMVVTSVMTLQGWACLHERKRPSMIACLRAPLPAPFAAAIWCSFANTPSMLSGVGWPSVFWRCRQFWATSPKSPISAYISPRRFLVTPAHALLGISKPNNSDRLKAVLLIPMLINVATEKH